jgi:hypothetical protein
LREAGTPKVQSAADQAFGRTQHRGRLPGRQQTGDHVESSTKLEVTHVTGVEGNARKAFAGDGQELSVQIEALKSVAVAEKLEVPARAARHVEQRSGIGHA